MIMRILATAVAVLAGGALPLPVRAQVSAVLDSAHVAAMMANALQMNKPAAFVLQHRSELTLSAAQVSTLEALVGAQRDSASVRQARIIRQMLVNPPSSALVAAAGWSGDIDEAALRAAACRQSATQVELMLAAVGDRRAVAAVLTPAQVAQLPQLQTDAMLKVMQRP